MTDAELELDVTDELAWDPKVDSEEIAVSADSGTVTLRGTVGSDVLQALMLDALVPSSIDANVKGGFVTLTGTADWQYQRDEAEFIAGNVAGVTGIENDVYLTSPLPYAGDVKDSIKKAMNRDAKLDAENIGVDTMNGTAVLTGTVRSWAEHDSAVQAAWAAPGVTNVDDRLAIVY